MAINPAEWADLVRTPDGNYMKKGSGERFHLGQLTGVLMELQQQGFTPPNESFGAMGDTGLSPVPENVMTQGWNQVASPTQPAGAGGAPPARDPNLPPWADPNIYKTGTEVKYWGPDELDAFLAKRTVPTDPEKMLAQMHPAAVAAWRAKQAAGAPGGAPGAEAMRMGQQAAPSRTGQSFTPPPRSGLPPSGARSGMEGGPMNLQGAFNFAGGYGGYNPMGAMGGFNLSDIIRQMAQSGAISGSDPRTMAYLGQPGGGQYQPPGGQYGSMAMGMPFGGGGSSSNLPYYMGPTGQYGRYDGPGGAFQVGGNPAGFDPSTGSFAWNPSGGLGTNSYQYGGGALGPVGSKLPTQGVPKYGGGMTNYKPTSGQNPYDYSGSSYKPYLPSQSYGSFGPSTNKPGAMTGFGSPTPMGEGPRAPAPPWLNKPPAIGGAQPQLPQYARGTTSVPATGPALLHEDEMVLPAPVATKVRATMGVPEDQSQPILPTDPVQTMAARPTTTVVAQPAPAATATDPLANPTTGVAPGERERADSVAQLAGVSVPAALAAATAPAETANTLEQRARAAMTMGAPNSAGMPTYTMGGDPSQLGLYQEMAARFRPNLSPERQAAGAQSWVTTPRTFSGVNWDRFFGGTTPALPASFGTPTPAVSAAQAEGPTTQTSMTQPMFSWQDVLAIAQGQLPAGMNPQGLSAMGQGQSSLAQLYGAALPAPNKIVGRNLWNMDPSTFQFLAGGYEANGYDWDQVLHAVQANMPGRAAWNGGYAGIGR